MSEPKRLFPGAHIRVVAPARSLSIIGHQTRSIALRRLKDLGLEVSFGQHVESCHYMASGTVNERLEDLHSAFADPEVDGILTAIGGFNAIEILDRINYDLIRKNPKVFCGFSDISVLTEAFYSKAGLPAYHGPHFSTFGMPEGCEYILDYFVKGVFSTESFVLSPSVTWSDDEWYLPNVTREFRTNEGPRLLRGKLPESNALRGPLMCGHLRALNALQGTCYEASLERPVLLIEEDFEVHAGTFLRQLYSLVMRLGGDNISAILIGRFQDKSKINQDALEHIVRELPVGDTPILSGLDFGHTTPFFTVPFGAECEVRQVHTGVEIVLVRES